MHTHGNPVASVPKMGFIASMMGDELPDESDIRVLNRYFFLFPIQHRKQKKGGTNLTALCAFGPYSNRYAVSFMRTSARALGLL
ncbi:hypothetical protein [Zoogloea sp.]|uniref:hypothetical protein n=1 Tax=Zoogloea sp. TaxID=49181 RepID=UPI002622115B|nr:hypothetical protein [Zoogloea sp.]